MDQVTVLNDIDTQINNNGVNYITGPICNAVLKNMYLNIYSAEIGVSLLPTVSSTVVLSTDDIRTILSRLQLSISNKVSNATHTGDATGSTTLTLATVNSNVGSFGSTSKTISVTVNGKGLITSASEQNIQITESQVSNLTSDLAARALITYVDSQDTAILSSANLYADSLLSNYDSKPNVSYASTSALSANTYSNGSSGVGATLTGNVNGPLVIDSVTIITGQVGQRVLITAESTAANNGWYTITQIGIIGVSPYILTRSVNSDQAAEIGSGYLTSVIAPDGVTTGSNNGKVFISIAPNPFTVGTSNLTFSLVGNTYSAGTGLSLSGNTFSVTNPSTGTNTGDETATSIAAINHGATTKSVLVDADEVTGQNSANGFSLIKTLWSDAWVYISSKITYTFFGSFLHAASNKTTPVDADEVGIWDSVSGLFQRVSFTNIKAFLKTYFDTIYATISVLNNKSFTIIMSAGVSSPADSTTYYFGIPTASNAGFTTGVDSRYYYISKTCTVKEVYIHALVGGTIGSNEGVTISLETYNVGSVTPVVTTLITNTLTLNDADRNNYVATTGLSIALTAGMNMQIKLLSPVFATNPTLVNFNVYLNCY